MAVILKTEVEIVYLPKDGMYTIDGEGAVDVMLAEAIGDGSVSQEILPQARGVVV